MHKNACASGISESAACSGMPQMVLGSWCMKSVLHKVHNFPWTHYLPTGLDNLTAATAHTNTRL